MSLCWTEILEPNDDCCYTHVITKTPMGNIYITWKGWKESPSYDGELPWGDYVYSDSLTDAKREVQEKWNSMAMDMMEMSSL